MSVLVLPVDSFKSTLTKSRSRLRVYNTDESINRSPPESRGGHCLIGEPAATLVAAGRLGLMKEPATDQRRENEMAFDPGERWRVTPCYRSAK